MSEISDLERDFQNEQKGEGSLSVFITNGESSDYIGYNINPEDVEAIYFEGIGVPRWESLKADSVEEQTAMYWDRFNECMAKFPLIGRVRDTDVRVEYTDAEVPGLIDECRGISGSTDNAKALRSIEKVSLAANRAVENQAGLNFKPSQLPDFNGF